MSVENIGIKKIYIAGNRGPCGGVNMALQAAEQVLDIVGGREIVWTPWDIIHNKPTMDNLYNRGLKTFNLEWSQVPDGSIIFNPAHGAPPDFFATAEQKNCLVVDVTCPLVKDVYKKALDAQAAGQYVIYIGERNHPEPKGVLGRLQPDRVKLIENIEDFRKLTLSLDQQAIVLSQTTFGTAEVGEIYQAARMKAGFAVPDRSNICYATDTRQKAVYDLIERYQIDALCVVGSLHSHNSQELVSIGRKANLPSFSVDSGDEMDQIWKSLSQNQIINLGLTSGASVVDNLLFSVVDWVLKKNPVAEINYLDQVIKEQDRTFSLPREAIKALESRYATKE
jgi:4-hydroxy-3-methylbut-2-en-1-yl diphosphate reductase